jgi:opacity protein-like surface antigen
VTTRSLAVLAGSMQALARSIHRSERMTIKRKRLHPSPTPRRNLYCLAAVSLALAATSAVAADRLHSGEWEVTYDTGSTVKVCMKPADVELYNGDEKTIRARLEQKFSGHGGCALKDLKVTGDRIAVTATCNGATHTETTTYHGDSYDQENSTGKKAHAKRIGACSG